MTEFRALHKKWLSEDPAYIAEYRSMEPEFAIAVERIRARIDRARPLLSSAKGCDHGASESATR